MISNGLCPSTADRIRGSLVGGAAGDALGYAIEFQSEASIFSRYGAEGITSYEYDTHRGCALFSDDTQMRAPRAGKTHLSLSTSAGPTWTG